MAWSYKTDTHDTHGEGDGCRTGTDDSHGARVVSWARVTYSALATVATRAWAIAMVVIRDGVAPIFLAMAVTCPGVARTPFAMVVIWVWVAFVPPAKVVTLA